MQKARVGLDEGSIGSLSHKVSATEGSQGKDRDKQIFKVNVAYQEFSWQII